MSARVGCETSPEAPSLAHPPQSMSIATGDSGRIPSPRTVPGNAWHAPHLHSGARSSVGPLPGPMRPIVRSPPAAIAAG